MESSYPAIPKFNAWHQALLEAPVLSPCCAFAARQQLPEVSDLRETIDWHYQVWAHFVRPGRPFAAGVAGLALVV